MGRAADRLAAAARALGNSLAAPPAPRYASGVFYRAVSRFFFGWITRASVALLGAALAACGDADVEAPDPDVGCAANAPPERTASCISSFTPGEGAGFGMDALPSIVLGEPHGGGALSGGLDVLSLGKGGEITIGFGGNTVIDGSGPDFIVFENAFYVGGDPAKVFKELGVVSVSEDGGDFKEFPCHEAAYPYDGCAGWRAVFASPESGVSAFDPAVSGGDPFDLADVGLASARFIRIRDISMNGAAPNAGFDLDAVAALNAALP